MKPASGRRCTEVRVQVVPWWVPRGVPRGAKVGVPGVLLDHASIVLNSTKIVLFDAILYMEESNSAEYYFLVSV